MPTNTLSDTKCRTAKARAKAYKLFDGGGLYLWMSPTGAKTWRLAYRLKGRQQTMSLGPYPEVSLAQARAKRDEHRSALHAGDDPMAPRRATRAGKTLDEAIDEYWAGRQDVSAGYRANAVNALKTHLVALLKRNLASITRDDLLDPLLRMDAAGLLDYVRKVRMWAGQVWEWAVERGYATINPADLIKPKKAFSKKKVDHFAALQPHEVPELMQRLSLEARLMSVLACRLLAYTWTRTVELRMMEWAELHDDDTTWIIPEGKMKRARDHVVPLPRQATELIEELRRRARPGSPYVFPSEHRADRPMSENAVLYLLYRLGYQGRMTGHGWRSVASTWANERGYNEDAIERQLAHAPEDKTRAAYNRAKYLPERRKMLQDWADWLDACSADVDTVGAQSGQAPAAGAA